MPNGSRRWADGRHAWVVLLLVGLLVLLTSGAARAQDATPEPLAPAAGAPAGAPSAAPAVTPRTLPPSTVLPTPEAVEPFDWTGALVDLAWKLGVVVVLAYVVLALLRRYSQGGLPGQRRGEIQVLEATTLAPNRAVYLVRAGNRRLLLGVTPTQITLLTELPPLPPTPGTEPFAAALHATSDSAAARPDALPDSR